MADIHVCKLISAFAFVWLMSAADSFAIEINGPTDIIDGDTIQIGSQKIRLHGIDTAETSQRCKLPNGKTWRCAKAAIDRLANHIAIGPVKCSGNEFDQYDRLIAVCHSANGVEINRDLVANGLAWAFVKFSKDYMPDEAKARKAKMGIWMAPTQTPWDYRAERWKVAEQEAPEGCLIKGNISPNGKIYHTPWSRSYKKTKISPERGEKWFCSEREALDAGWRAPLQ